MNRFTENGLYSLRIILNNLIELNLSGSMFNTTLLRKENSNYTFRLEKSSAPRTILESRDCAVELEGVEHCSGTVSECTEDERFVYLRCSINGKHK
ncbi:MAG: hypothetical protein JNL74_05455 [Fibrobacteres bacterium]|nr:hypothetical protein [Fibrobacterota bacterium]